MGSMQILGMPDLGLTVDTEIIALPSGTRYQPTADTAAARGTALATALTAFEASSDTVLQLPKGQAFDFATAFTFTPTVKKTIKGHSSTIRAATGTDLNFVLKIVNNTAHRIIFEGLDVDHQSLTRTSGTGDTVFISGSGPVTWRKSRIANGPHDSNTNPASPSSEGSLLRLEGSGARYVEETELVDPAYASFRVHSEVTYFCNVWSRVVTYRAGAYQRHGYCDSEAANMNIRLFSWDGGGIYDRAAHKVNLNLDPSSDGPHWGDTLKMQGLTFDIGSNHLNSDSDSFVKVHYWRHFSMVDCTEWHSNNDTVVSGVYTDNVNTSSLESFLNIGAVGNTLIDICRFDGNIKGIGSGSTQAGKLVVRNCEFGVNAYIDYVLSNVANWQDVEWVSNRCYNVYGGGSGAARCLFDLDGFTRGQTIRLIGANYFQTRFPTVGGQAGGVFRYVPLRVGAVACDPITVEAVSGTMGIVQGFSEEERLAVTAYPGDPYTLHIERSIIQGAAQSGLGNSTGVYVATQQQPTTQTTTNTNAFPDITGTDGAAILNDNWGPGGNGHPPRWNWTGTIWTAPEPYIESAGDPTTTEWANSGDYGTHRNTTSGAVYWVRNVSGTIKKVAMT